MTLVNPLDTREVIQPRTLAEALVHLQRTDARPIPLAGGLSLLQGTAAGLPVLIDLSRLGWRYVKIEDGNLRIGATTPLQDLIDSSDLSTWAGGLLQEAARRVAPRVQRHQISLGGLIANPQPDDELTAALVAVDAQVVCYTPSRRDEPLTLDLGTFIQGARPKEPFLVAAVIVPGPTRDWQAVSERVARTPRDKPLVYATVAARATTWPWQHVHVVVGGAGVVPTRLTALESELEHASAAEEALKRVETRVREEWPGWDDWRASAAYRRHAAAVLVRRAIATLLAENRPA